MTRAPCPLRQRGALRNSLDPGEQRGRRLLRHLHLGLQALVHHLRSQPQRLHWRDNLRQDYPAFFWKMVNRYIHNGLRYLRVTQEGNEWVTHLYAHTFAVESQQRPQTRSLGKV